MEALAAILGGADLIIISAGTGYLNPELDHTLDGSVATFRFCRKTPRFRDFAEKPVVDCEALRQGGFRAKSESFGRIKSLQHFLSGHESRQLLKLFKRRCTRKPVAERSRTPTVALRWNPSDPE
jgi:hypothetical protein